MAAGPGRVGIPRPTTAQLQAYNRDKLTRQAAWLTRRFTARYGELPAELTEAYARAMTQTAQPREVVFLESVKRMDPWAFARLFKVCLERFAAEATPAQVQAEAEFDPVIGWGIDAARARQLDTRSTELSWWAQLLGGIGAVSSTVTDIYKAFGDAFSAGVRGVSQTAGAAAGGFFSGLLKGGGIWIVLLGGALYLYSTRNERAAA